MIEGRSRDARKTRRQQLGKLKDLVIQPATKARYDDAMRLFLEYLRWNKLPLPSQCEEVDRVASRYIEELWEEGDSRYLAQDTLSSLQHSEPLLKRRMLRSWRLIKAWQKHEIPARAPPLTPTTLSILAGWMHSRSPELALALLVGFHALLRSGELFQIKNRDIICSQNLVVLNLGHTKMGFRNAAAESASFRHSQISLMLQAWKTTRSPEALLVNVSASTFRQLFSRGLEATELAGAQYKPYSLRRGGATQVFLETQSYSAVCQRGRWSSERTTRIYIQDSVALLTELSTRLTPKQREYHNSWEQVLQRLELSRPSLVRRPGSNRGRGRKETSDRK